MSEAHITLAGHSVTRCELHIPGIGPWYADLELTEAPELTGPATLRIGEAAFSGTIAQGGTFGLQRRCRLIAGGAGWGREIPARSYAADNGVRAAAVARDAATAAGEALGSFEGGAAVLGAHFVREAGPASVALEHAAKGAPWYLDAAGLTHVGKRAAVAAARGSYEVLGFDPRSRVVTLACDDLRAIGIGSILTEGLDAPVTIAALDVQVTPGSIRVLATVGTTAQSKLADSLRAIVERIMSSKLDGLYRYRVSRMVADRVDVQCASTAAGLPDIASVSMWPGVAGAHAQLAPGSEVALRFIDGDPAQPAIVAFRGGPGQAPERLTLGGAARDGEAADLAHKGSAVEVLLPPMPIHGTMMGLPMTGVLTPMLPQTQGMVTNGSSRAGIKP